MSQVAPAATVKAAAVPETLSDDAGTRAVGHSILNRGGILLLNVSTGILTARCLHPAGRGELAAMLLWPVFLATATTVGIPSAMIYHLRQRVRDGVSIVVSGLMMATCFGMLATAAGVLLLPHWIRQYPVTVVRWAQIFLLTLPLWSVQIVGQAALEALELFTLSNIVQTMIPVSTLGGLLLFLAAGHLTAVTAGIAYTLAIIPTSGTILWFLWRRRAPEQRVYFSRSACGLLLHYGLRSCGIDLLGALALNIDQILVVGLLSPQAMGSYVVVLSLSRALLLFQSAVVMVLFPRAAGRAFDEVLHLVGHAVRMTTIISAGAGCAVCLLGPTLLRMMYGAQYLSAVGALRILVLEVILQGAVYVMAQAFMAVGRPGTVTLLQATGLSLSVPLMLLFIPRFGVAGAALALLLSTTARAILLLAGFSIFLGSRPPRVVPGRADVRELVLLARRAF